MPIKGLDLLLHLMMSNKFEMRRKVMEKQHISWDTSFATSSASRNELPAISASNLSPCHALQAESILQKKKQRRLVSSLIGLTFNLWSWQGSRDPKVMKTPMAGSPKSGFFLFSVLEDSNWPHSYPLTTLDKMSFCSYVTASAADLIPLFKDLETLADRAKVKWWFPVYKSRVVLCFLFTCQHLGESPNLICKSFDKFSFTVDIISGGFFRGIPKFQHRDIPSWCAPNNCRQQSRRKTKRPKETRRRRGSGGRRAKTQFSFKLKKENVVDPN